MKQIIKFLPILLIVFSCSNPSDLETSDFFDTEFYTFELNMADNADLAYDITGRQDGSSIILEYPDYSIPRFTWAPRFSTDAVSVEVEGVEQSSAVSQVDFSNTVTYTLTAESGLVQQFDVDLILQNDWMDMGSNPLLAGLYPTNIRGGYLHNLNPFVLCIDDTTTLRAYSFDLLDGTSWNEFFGGPNLIEKFDATNWNHQIWTVYQTTAGLIESRYCIPPNTWSVADPVTAVTGSGSGLHVFGLSEDQISEDRLYAAWIDDSASAKRPVVWMYDGAVWSDVGGSMSSSPITNFHAESFRAVSNGGSTLYAACIFAEAPDLIHLFKYEEASGSWTEVKYEKKETSNSSDESDRVIIDMYFDSEKQAPVIFVRSKDNNYQNVFTIKALYYNELAAVWTNLDYIDPFYVPESDYSSLSIDWFENNPSAVYGTVVQSWDETSWDIIGGAHYTTSTPSVQTLAKGTLNTYLTALRDDDSGNLIVRFHK